MVKPSMKGKKKKWYSILANDIFNKQVLGQSFIYESEQLIGKCIQSNLMNLTGDMKKQNTNITFKVDTVKGDQGFCKIHRYELIPAFVKRMIRRDRDKVDSSFVAESKDKVAFRVKPILITQKSVPASIKTSLRAKTKEFVVAKSQSLDFDEIISALVLHRYQEELKKTLNKIYPMKFAEIRCLLVTKR